jgi:crotonobetainyl-CoA:carnitine CoA-transferase CaiB-like acyl-CoA transferase
MLENMASFVASEHLGAATFEPPVGPTGDGRLLSPNYRPVPTKDGYVTVRPNTNAQAFAFFDAIGRPELKTDPRFDSAASRTKNAKAYFEVQATCLGHKTTDEWVELFDKLDVPAARYNSIDELLTDPHLEGRRLLQGRAASERGQDPAAASSPTPSPEARARPRATRRSMASTRAKSSRSWATARPISTRWWTAKAATVAAKR